ncbi:MAG: efflux RND transporter periplasmic adaptor subunit [Bacteroidetes bacterium]|nr:efflux RND transporter periplasmic adaptor subunit [Bacteroidota bacterium]
MKKNKKLFWIIGAGIIVILVILVVLKRNGTIGGSSETKVATEFVAKRSIIETVSANGKIQPETEVKVSPDVSGEIIELLIKEGDVVKKGQVLAKINPELYRSSLDRVVAALNSQKANLANAKARLAQVKAQFINAKNSFDRSKKLWEQKTISSSEYDQAVSNFETAKSEVTAGEENVKASEYGVGSAAASVKEANENFTKTTLFAPVDGIISKLNVEKGERVAGASQFSAGTEVLRIANLDLMRVNVSVNENDIVRVKLGDTALIEVDSYLNRKFKGLVTEIATSAATTGLTADQVTNFDVKVRILKESYTDLIPKDKPNFSPFRPGMSANVEIRTKRVANVLTIPIQAVTTRADSAKLKLAAAANKEKNKDADQNDVKKPDEPTQEIVFVYVNGVAKLTKVKTGVQDNTNIQILSGLKEKDEVISAPYKVVTKKLKDGDKVTKVDKSKLYDSKE